MTGEDDRARRGAKRQRADSKVEKETAGNVEHQRKAPSSQVRTPPRFSHCHFPYLTANNSGAYPCCLQISSHLFMHVSHFRRSALMQDKDYYNVEGIQDAYADATAQEEEYK